MSSDTVQQFKDHSEIHGLMNRIVEMSKAQNCSPELVSLLEHLLQKEESHIAHTYTVMMGTKEAWFAQYGPKVATAVIPLFLALAGHWTMLLTGQQAEVEAEPAQVIIKVVE
jgi:hypothetical protein